MPPQRISMEDRFWAKVNSQVLRDAESNTTTNTNTGDTMDTKTIHDTAVAKGFWDGTDNGVTPEFVLAKLALVHSEVSEVLEAYRKQQGSAAILEEFADVFIRCYDLIEGLYEHGVIDHNDVDAVVAAKTAKNAGRPPKHGNLI